MDSRKYTISKKLFTFDFPVEEKLPSTKLIFLNQSLFEKLYLRQHNTDMEIHFINQENNIYKMIHTHKLIMQSFEYFEKSATFNGSASIIQFHFSETIAQVFENVLLPYFYGVQELQISVENVVHLLLLCNYFCLDDLAVAVIEHYLKKDLIDELNVVPFVRLCLNPMDNVLQRSDYLLEVASSKVAVLFQKLPNLLFFSDVEVNI